MHDLNPADLTRIAGGIVLPWPGGIPPPTPPIPLPYPRPTWPTYDTLPT